uniref:Uncharacterized protein n=1 Tax=Knipowitschia caucasica TaxID=637954 RepID=A0AAV2K2B7_KNICA
MLVVLIFILQYLLDLDFKGAISVFFDGDWFFCFSTRWDSNLVDLPCKDTKLLSEKEKETINGYKIESFDIGLGIISVLLLLWTVAQVVKGCSRLPPPSPASPRPHPPPPALTRPHPPPPALTRLPPPSPASPARTLT